ncbi:methyltransferase [Clostridia bacterium]|nr:methyltransferase [Clostridia bacterium]
MQINMSNTELFSEKASLYAKYRPTYPEELYDFLYTKAGFTAESIVADIGSGTGLFTAGLIKRCGAGGKIYAIEPNADMRKTSEEYFKESLEKDEFARLVISNGDAENTTLPDESVDFITAAQAFHWFDREKFRAECKRILRPTEFGGKAALIWNTEDPDDELHIRLGKIFDDFLPEYKGHSNGTRNDSVGDFFNGNEDLYTRSYNIEMTADRLIGRCLSSSHTPKESEGRIYREFIAAISELFDEFEDGGTVMYRMHTQCYLGKI